MVTGLFDIVIFQNETEEKTSFLCFGGSDAKFYKSYKFIIFQICYVCKVAYCYIKMRLKLKKRIHLQTFVIKKKLKCVIHQIPPRQLSVVQCLCYSVLLVIPLRLCHLYDMYGIALRICSIQIEKNTVLISE